MPTKPTSELPIDREHLRQLSDGDTSFEVELLQVFLEDAHLHLAAAKEALVIADFNKLKSEAHHLKGSSGNVGATAIQPLAYDLEQYSIQQVPDSISSTIIALEEQLAIIEAFINSAEFVS